MKSFSFGKGQPFGSSFNRYDAGKNLRRLAESRKMGVRLRSDRDSESPADDKPSSLLFPVEHAEVEEEERPCAAGPVESGVCCEEDNITRYLKDISNYPLLTQPRETELARIIRDGQDELVQMIEEHAGEHKIYFDLNEKLKKLRKEAKTYPGVRDKMSVVILRTLGRATREHPENSVFFRSLTRGESIIKKIDTAKQEIVQANLRLVLTIAKRYRGRGMTFGDLIQEGNLGLLKAVGRFDHTLGNRFTTYATWWVRQSIIRGIYDKTRTIRLPVHLTELRHRLYKVYYELIKELDREPAPAEIAERSNLSVEKVHMALTLCSEPISLETSIGEDDHKLGDFLEDTGAVSPFEKCSDSESAQTIRLYLSTLQPREEKILRLRFGLDGSAPETLERIGKIINVSKERVRQIEKKALCKLKRTCNPESL